MAVNIVMESCQEPQFPLRAAVGMLSLDPKILVMLGDDLYYNSDTNWGAYNVPFVSVTSTSQNIQDKVHGQFAKPGWKELLARRNAGLMKILWAGGDDHRMGDSFDSSYPTSESGTGGKVGAVSQATLNP